MSSPIVSRSAAGLLAAPRAVLSGVVVASALAWAFVLFGPTGMGGGIFPFIGAWAAMMVAMMLPSAAPFVLLYGRSASGGATAALAIGYLLVWAATGVPAFYAHELLPMSAGPVALAVAGLYQLTPLKAACLQGCRTPADFLVRRWGRSPLRLGVEHGAWCLGCCWALMGVLVLVGSMGLAWVVGVAGLVALEKIGGNGRGWARAIGFALLLAALVQGVAQWHGSSMEMS